MRKLKTILGILTILVIITAISFPAATMACTYYTVTYNGNGNTSGSVPVDSHHYNYHDWVTVLDNTGGLAKTGYTFNGWNTKANGSGTSYAPGATFRIEGNTTLYAQWTAIPTYTVTYDGNGYTSGSVPVDSNHYTSGASVTVLGPGSMARTGYTFNGWNTQANGLGTPYAPGNTFNITVNTTLYAQWAAAYTVTYDGNGNTSGTAPTDPSSPYNYNATVTVLGPGSMVRSGYTFSHWNTALDGSGTSYYLPASFSMPNNNVTLYAQWTANLISITVNPPSATMPIGANQQYTATAHYSDGSTLDITTLADWSVGGGGTIGLNTGLFNATTPGNAFPVTASWGGLSGTAEVNVIAHGELLFITVNPPNATIPVGATQQYTATGYDGYGNSWDITGIVVWSVNGGGTIDLSGLFTGVTPGGPFTVTATWGAISGTALVTVVEHGELLSITVNPPDATILVGTNQQYTATGHDAYGNSWDITNIVTWSVDGGGDITTDSGLFTATTPGGAFTVTATWGLISGSISGTALVTVVAPTTTTTTTTTTETTTTTTETTTETIPTETQTIGPPVTETNNWWVWTVVGVVACILLLIFLLFFFQWQKVLVFVKEIPTIGVGKVSETITVQVQYRNGKPYNVRKDEKVYLDTKSSSGKFDVKPSGAFAGTLKNVIIPKDENSTSFYYKDSNGGEYTMTANKKSWLPWKRGIMKVIVK
jgi:uncharacterized repeat protein (TIGR02543 family)